MRAALLTATLLLGCNAAVTEIVVSTETDRDVPGELDAVRWEVHATAIGGGVHERETALVPGAPVRMTLVHEGGPLGPLTLRALGLRDGREVTRAEIEARFLLGRSVFVPLDLFRACGATRCGPAEACDAEGRCVQVVLPDAGMTPPPDAGPPPASDSGVDAGDACAETCGAGRCECEGSCDRCALHCADDCRDVRCSGRGRECAIEARDASNVEVECKGGARCVIDARGASNAETIRCREGSDCELDCRGTSNCRLDCDEDARCLLRCDGDNCEAAGEGCEERRECGGGVIACNRDCP